MSTHAHGETRAGARHRATLGRVLALVAGFMLIEFAAGFATNSLALVSDAGHMATDALGLGMALAAVVAADRAGRDGSRTFGLYRLEILAALANAVLLFVLAGYVLVEAARRIGDPPEVLSGAMLVVAVGGLVVNLVAWRMLRRGAAESINVEGAYVEVVADLVGSLGVIAAAVTVALTGWLYADALIGAAIGVFILPRAWRLGGRAVRVLIQAAPSRLDLEEMRGRLLGVPGVSDVHDLHVWTLTSEMDVASLHLMVEETADAHAVLDEASSLLRDEYAIAHATVQVEPESHQSCTEVTW